jgi:hypothetical protein
MILGVGPAMAAGLPIATVSHLFVVTGCPVSNPCKTVVWQPDLRVRTRQGATLSRTSAGMCLSGSGDPRGAVVIRATQARVSSS